MPAESAMPAAADETAELPDEEEESSAAPLRLKIMTPLLLVLPLFGQMFHYMKDLPPLWALSKAFPVLSLPLAFILLGHPRAPVSRQIIITFLWLVLMPTFAAIFYFDQNFFIGIGAQVKILPLLYFFSFMALLLYLQPTLRELAAAFLIYGIITYLALIILWTVIPRSWYSGTYVFGQSPLFSSDNRGTRIRMPMYFGIITLFYCYRRFLRTHAPRWLFATAIGFGLTMGIVKTRAMIVGIAGVVVINGFIAATPLLRFILIFLAPVGLTGLFSVGYLSTMFRTDASTGFDLRWKTAAKAAEFLGVDPVRWIFGVGTLSPTNSDNLFAYFDHPFFLADITWLGILFEFGILGAGLIIFYEVRALLFFRKLKERIDSDFLGSLKDYALYVLLISNLYPPTLTPGETAVILAVFVYVWQRLQSDDALADDALEEPEAL